MPPASKNRRRHSEAETLPGTDPLSDREPSAVRGSAARRPVAGVVRFVRAKAHAIGKFGVVGLVALIVDVGVFNLLRWGGGDGPLEHRPLLAKALSTLVATMVSWLGNRLWTFRHQRRSETGQELLLFVAMCTLGLGVSVGCLGFSHYVLGLTSPLADNISANLVGVGLASVLRFLAYDKIVFNNRVVEHGDDLVAELAAQHHAKPS